ncbi:MAG: hypothetical protein IKV25_01655 [Clostridia bacterium]|nr:hypothetical protein [Clostridia bacterium]
MDENKEKLDGQQPDVETDDLKQEMEDLARIFKEELDKTKQEAEELAIEELEVEGYNPQKVSKDDSNKKSDEELCEYCGERARGTEKNPKSPYCQECESLLEKCPYDYKGIIAVLVIACITIGAMFCFAVNMPIFSIMKKADKAATENKIFTALIEYESALEFVENKETDHTFYNLHEKRIELYYDLGNIDSVNYEIETYLKEDDLKLPLFKDTREIVSDIEAMEATSVIIGQHVDLNVISEKNYQETLDELDKLIGKKIYVKGNVYNDSTNESFTPDGTETVYDVDAGWVYIAKYQASVLLEKEAKDYVDDMEKAVESSEFMKSLAGYMLADAYVKVGQYDKAESLAKDLKEINCEATDYYLIMSLVSRYRDKDYNKAIEYTEQGVKALEESSGETAFVMRYSPVLLMQKGINLIMLDKNDEAVDSINDCCYALAETYIDSYTTMIVQYPQAWEIAALVSLQVGDNDNYKAMEENLKQTVEDTKQYELDLADLKSGAKTLKNLVESGRYDLI